MTERSRRRPFSPVDHASYTGVLSFKENASQVIIRFKMDACIFELSLNRSIKIHLITNEKHV